MIRTIPRGRITNPNVAGRRTIGMHRIEPMRQCAVENKTRSPGLELWLAVPDILIDTGYYKATKWVPAAAAHGAGPPRAVGSRTAPRPVGRPVLESVA